MNIVVGLGNIGPQYTLNRHNAGWIVLDNFVQQIEEKDGLKIQWKEEPKLKALTARVPFENEIVFLVKPTTLMNNSGQCVSKVLNFFKEPLEDLIVIYDDIDLPLGKIRVRSEGSAGTHNGMKSLIEELGNQNFHRIRIGIESRGTLAPQQQDLASYVLTNFTEQEVPLLKEATEEAIEALKKLIVEENK